jgi:hypothetical protein
MIDFIKIWSYISLEQVSLLKNSVDFMGSYNVTTGESISRNRSGKEVSPFIEAEAKSMKIKLYPNGRCEIAGSIHKYFNDGKHNFNYFGRKELSYALDELNKHLNISVSEFRLSNIEIGVNITPPVDSDIIIDNAFMYKNKVFENKFHSDEGNYKQAGLTEYLVKLYNKRKHYTNQGYKINNETLRFELKYTVMRSINDLGVVCVKDLEKGLESFKKPLMNAWDHILLYDHTIDYYLPEKTRLEYSNPNYWMSLKQTNQRTFKKHSNSLRKLNLIHSKGIYLQTQEAIANMLDRIIHDK